MDDVVAGKVASLERCLARIRDLIDTGDPDLDDRTVEEAVTLNLLRACEQAIAIAMHVVSARRLGLPQNSRAAFDLLCEHGVIDEESADCMKRMIGFRNVAVHEYQRLERAILVSILRHHLNDFVRFATAVVRADGP